MSEVVDFVEAVNETRAVDVVDRMEVPGHYGHRVEVSPFGIIYCLTCMADGITIGSLTDYSEFQCVACSCPKTCHSYEDGRCLQCGRRCAAE